MRELNERRDLDGGSSGHDSWLVDVAWKQFESVAGHEVTPGSGAASGTLDRDRLDPHAFAGYRILQEIHRGGQGVVYQAIQESTRRKVAIKVLKQGPFADATELARFEREVQVLSRLNHPNIVTIHDRGRTLGHSYLVMDYVPGRPLDAYLNESDRAVDAVLCLFIKICEAVHAAHLRGIIHRDLKPGNIRIDDAGEPHVLDFGLAKVWDSSIPGSSADSVHATVTGQFVGSMPWASPEQVQGHWHNIDLRTDVYSLGVILYQILTGAFPYPATGAARDVQEHILHTPPVRPGARRRDLDNEIETIVLKCLAKEPARRYQSAGELARDIGRYLADEPIEAKRDSFGYVLRKHIRKHLFPVVMVAAFAVAMSAGLIFSLAQWRRAEQQADVARRALDNEARQRALADQSARETRQMAEFQSSLLSNIRIDEMGRGAAAIIRDKVRDSLARQFVGQFPDRRKRTDEEIAAELKRYDAIVDGMQPVDAIRLVLSRYLLRDAAETVKSRFAGQPFQADLLQTLGKVYLTFGLSREAQEPLTKALELRRSAHGDRSTEAAGVLVDLGRAHYDRNEREAARRNYQDALAIFKAARGDHRRDIAETQQVLGQALTTLDQTAEAVSILHEALATFRGLSPHPDKSVAVCLGDLALAHYAAGNYAEAEPLLREALAIQEAADATEDVEYAHELLNLGLCLIELGRSAAAETLLRRALSLNRRIRGDDHFESVAFLNNLGLALLKQGKNAEAEKYLRQCVDRRRKIIGEEDMGIPPALLNLSVVVADEGHFDEAEALCRESLMYYRKLHGPEHRDTLRCLNSLASIYFRKGDYAAAEPVQREVLALRTRIFGENHADVALVLGNLAASLFKQKKYDEAEPLARKAMAVSQNTLPRGHPTESNARMILALTLTAQGCEEGRPIEDRAAKFREAETMAAEVMNYGESTKNPIAMKKAFDNYIRLYEGWHTVAPQENHDRDAEMWRTRQVQWTASTQPAAGRD